MSKHTPGPWALVETPHAVMISAWHVQIGEDEVNLFPYKCIYSEDRSQSGLVKCDQRMADARLIAAAPDYDEGARAFVAYEDASRRGDDVAAMQHYEDAHRILRAAIAKAEGAQ